MHNQTESKGRQQRTHHMEEWRNLICGQMKRGDPVTFAVQTKPWLREIDLWKSYVNVDLAMD